jgi:hypothetical protein
MTTQNTPVPAPRKDPMKGFRGIMAATLIIEAIVVALAIPVVARLGGGIGTTTGALVFALLVGLIVTAGLLKHRWAIGVVIALHVVMVASWFAMTALGAVGVVFSLVWVYLLWLRRDMTRRIAEGRLPAQQQPPA